MHKLNQLQMLFFGAVLAAAAQASEPQTRPLPDSITVMSLKEQSPAVENEVREYFVFWCPHCRELQPALRTMRDELAPELNVYPNIVHWSEDMSLTELALAAAVTSPKLSALPEAEQQRIIDRLTDGVFSQFFPENEQTQNLAVTFEGMSVLYRQITGDELPQTITHDQQTLMNMWRHKSKDIEEVPLLVINGRCLLSTAAVTADPRKAAQDVMRAVNHPACNITEVSSRRF